MTDSRPEIISASLFIKYGLWERANIDKNPKDPRTGELREYSAEFIDRTVEPAVLKALSERINLEPKGRFWNPHLAQNDLKDNEPALAAPRRHNKPGEEYFMRIPKWPQEETEATTQQAATVSATEMITWMSLLREAKPVPWHRRLARRLIRASTLIHKVD